MKISVKLLKELVDFSWNTDELCERLTGLGLEVETVYDTTAMLDGAVAARISAVKPHPDSDHLQLCDVDDGSGTYTVVCGAPNVVEGAVAALARPGMTMPAGGTVGKAVIRGVESHGMLLSEKELGLAVESSGILILEPAVAPGTPLVEALDMADHIIEFEITPNRSDCLSITGIAREVAAITGNRLRFPDCTLEETGKPLAESCSVTVRDGDLCYRYCARLVRNVSIAPSPQWMKAALFKLGVRPINNVVDVTNYVLMEMGQPLHAFDHDILAGPEIIVRKTAPGETIVTLDGETRAMPEDGLLICDAEHPVAVAGVMGGQNTFITDTTNNVLLESAHFDPVSVRVTARKLGLSSESSYRFERGVDDETVPRALDRAARLIAELAGGEIAPGMIDAVGKPVEKRVLTLRPVTVKRILGLDLAPEESAQLLRKLEIGTEVAADGTVRSTVPLHRNDLEREIDLVEEVARMYGYENIAPEMPTVTSQLAVQGQPYQLVNRTREILRGMGFYETVTYSFINPQRLSDLDLPDGDRRRNPVHIKNPLSEEMSVMRTTLLPGLADTVSRNVNKQNRDVAVFEIGHTFFPTEPDDQLPEEVLTLGIALTGSALAPHWNTPAAPADFYRLKGVLGQVMEAMGTDDVHLEARRETPFHPGRCAVIKLAGNDRGIMGEIHPDIAGRFDLPERTYVLELDLGAVLGYTSPALVATSPPRYPKVLRDLALVVPDEVKARDLADTIRRSAGDRLENLQLFDVYRGDRLEEGVKSLGFSLELRKEDGTLTEEEVDGIISRILAAAEEAFGARIRV